MQNQADIEFDIGNHYGVVKDPKVSWSSHHKDNKGKLLKHHWSAFVRVKYPSEHPPIEKLIQHVDFTLHETFKIPKVKVFPSALAKKTTVGD